MRKKIIMSVFSLVLCMSLAACSTTTAGDTSSAESTSVDMFTKELLQNDYRGGYTRATVIRDITLDMIENMKQKNSTIREDSPNSFWTAEGYQDFVSTFLTTPIINDTQWFNEEETAFDEIVAQIGRVSNSFTAPADNNTYTLKYPHLNIVRNEKDDYSISGMDNVNWQGDSNYYGNMSYRILYDCDKDWSKAYCTLDLRADSLPNVTTEMYEYARLDNNTFAIQTSTERLIVKLAPSAEDVDLRERVIEEVYYSRLSAGKRTTFEAFEPLPEINWETGGYMSENAQFNATMETYSLLNLKGDLATRYGVRESMFNFEQTIQELDENWVFEDKALQQAIVYKEGTLVVCNFNKLMEKYEKFIFYEGQAPNEEAIDLVNAKELVGVQSITEENVVQNLYIPENYEYTKVDVEVTTETVDVEAEAHNNANMDVNADMDVESQAETPNTEE